jgi:hypothetical protein
MGKSRKIRNGILRWLVRSITLLVVVEFAIKVRRPHRMDGPAVNMPRFSMTMIGFGMHMEQGNHEHPHRQPQNYPEAKTQKHFTLCLNHG